MNRTKTPEDVIRWLRSEKDDLFTRYADAIERLQKENSRLREPRCINEPAGDPCKFCGAREATDVCRDGTDHIIRERDAALAEVERLKGELGTAREASDRVIEHLDGRIEELQGQIELWKDMTGKARIETALRGTVGR